MEHPGSRQDSRKSACKKKRWHKAKRHSSDLGRILTDARKCLVKKRICSWALRVKAYNKI
jgi:hypothetical protein